MKTIKFTDEGISIGDNPVLTTASTSAENLELLEALLKELSTSGTVENLTTVTSRLDIVEKELSNSLKIVSNSFKANPSTLPFNAGANQSVTFTASIEGLYKDVFLKSGSNSDTNVTNFVSNGKLSYTFSNINAREKTTFTLTVKNDTKTETATITVSPTYPVYYGASEKLFTASEIASKAETQWVTHYLTSFVPTIKDGSAPEKSYVQYVIRANLTPKAFNIGGFDYTPSNVGSLNINGMDYNIWRLPDMGSGIGKSITVKS